MEKTDIKIKDLSMMLVSSVRYAVGRKTYIVSWTCEVVREYIDIINLNTVQVLIDSIEDAERFGTEEDHIEWLKLLGLLIEKKKELKNK